MRIGHTWFRSVGGLTPYRTCHTVTTATAAAEFSTTHGNHFYAGFSEQSVGVSIAVIGHDHTGLNRHNVITVVPLLAFCLICIATCLDYTKFLEPKGFLDHLKMSFAFFTNCVASLVVRRINAVTTDLIYNVAKDRDHISVTKAEHSVQVHRGPALRHQ